MKTYLDKLKERNLNNSKNINRHKHKTKTEQIKNNYIYRNLRKNISQGHGDKLARDVETNQLGTWRQKYPYSGILSGKYLFQLCEDTQKLSVDFFRCCIDFVKKFDKKSDSTSQFNDIGPFFKITMIRVPLQRT